MRRVVTVARALGPDRLDALLALALFVGGVVLVFATSNHQEAAVVVPAMALVAVLLALRRRMPVTVVLAIAVVGAVGQPLGRYMDNAAGGFLPYLIAAYTLGVHEQSRRRVVIVCGVLSVILCSTIVTTPDVSTPGDWLFVPLMAIAAPVFAGRLVGGQLRLSRELAQKNAELEATREQRARAAVADERARIARELHDVVAHSVSVMVVQAGAARRVLDRDSRRAEDAFGTIETTGREALVEMRRLLGMLRPQDEPARRAPQPGLARVDALVERARAAGLDVELRIRGDAAALPPGLDLAAYRVVQEALTNAIKHAGGAHAVVTVGYTDDELEVEVVDDGRRADAAPIAGAGHGLAGMRERVELYGGALRYGPREARGFAVSVRFPLANEVAA